MPRAGGGKELMEGALVMVVVLQGLAAGWEGMQLPQWQPAKGALWRGVHQGRGRGSQEETRWWWGSRQLQWRLAAPSTARW